MERTGPQKLLKVSKSAHDGNNALFASVNFSYSSASRSSQSLPFEYLVSLKVVSKLFSDLFPFTIILFF